VPASAFAQAGIVGPVITSSANGKVSLTSCPTLSPVTLLVGPGSSGISSIDLTTSAFKNTLGSGAAANMGAQLINAETGSVLVPSSLSGAISKTTDALGQADFYLGARYFSLGTVSAGGYSANATFSILYQ
jgi:type 1 fimbria pilin